MSILKTQATEKKEFILVECRFRRELNIKQDDLESGEESYVLLNFLYQLIGYLNDTN